MKKGITGHMIVKNEEQWIWYAINSVIDYIDTLFIYDTGSRDDTVKIIKSINSNKVNFIEKGTKDADGIVNLRNEQLQNTQTKWFMLIDGDEVWPRQTMEELCLEVKRVPARISALVVKARLPVGDLFHYQAKAAARYRIMGKVNHFNIRVYCVRPGYTWQGRYPLEAYTDKNGIPVQEKEAELKMLNQEYWHMTHLRRSRLDDHEKRKYEIGETHKARLPEVFYKDRPGFVFSPWVTYNWLEKVYALIRTPFVKFRRKKIRV